MNDRSHRWQCVSHAAWVVLATTILAACSSKAEKVFEPGRTTAPVEAVVEQPFHSTPFVPAGRIFYVAGDAPGASDDNNGLHPTYQNALDGPWRTIRHAAEVMGPGDTTYVRGGVYSEAGIIFARSGEPDKPIALISHGGEEVIIDGSESEEYESGIGMINGRGHYIIEGFTIRNMPWSGIATDEETSELYHNITIRSCVLYQNGWSGIDLAAVDGFLVENVEAFNNHYYGINITASKDGVLSSANGIVRDSSFHDHTGQEGHGLAINQGHDIVVSDNETYHNRIHGTDVSDWPKRGEVSHHITVERNFSYDNGVAGFSINSDSHHVVYRNNVAWRNGAEWAEDGTSSGFLCYEGCWHVSWYNNVSVANSDAEFFIEDEWAAYTHPDDALLIFQNNVTFENGLPEWDDQRPALVVLGDNWDLVATYNNWGGVAGENVVVVLVNAVRNHSDSYTSQEINAGAFQTGNISHVPEFEDMDSGDWRPRIGSPLIDAGIDLGQPFCGEAPDLGAYERCSP